MADYKEMYYTVARALEKVLRLNEEANRSITQAHQKAEDILLQPDKPPVELVPDALDTRDD